MVYTMQQSSVANRIPLAPEGSKNLCGNNDEFAYNTIKVRIPVSDDVASRFLSFIIADCLRAVWPQRDMIKRT